MGKEVEVVSSSNDREIEIRVGNVYLIFRIVSMRNKTEGVTIVRRRKDAQIKGNTWVPERLFKKARAKAFAILHHNGVPSRNKKVKIPKRQGQSTQVLVAKEKKVEPFQQAFDL